MSELLGAKNLVESTTVVVFCILKLVCSGTSTFSASVTNIHDFHNNNTLYWYLR